MKKEDNGYGYANSGLSTDLSIPYDPDPEFNDAPSIPESEFTEPSTLPEPTTNMVGLRYIPNSEYVSPVPIHNFKSVTELPIQALPDPGVDLPPPPSYKSLFGKLQSKVKKDELIWTNEDDLDKSDWAYFAVFAILLLLTFAASVACIVMGANYSCPARSMISSYLIVVGSISILGILMKKRS